MPSTYHRPAELIIHDPRLHEWGLPDYETPSSAGIDLRACIVDPLVLEPQAPAVLIDTGIAMHIGDPFIGAFIYPRSGQGHKRGLVLGNSVGVIDADYLGHIMISAWNRNPDGDPITIEPGERIAQLVFHQLARP